MEIPNPVWIWTMTREMISSKTSEPYRETTFDSVFGGAIVWQVLISMGAERNYTFFFQCTAMALGVVYHVSAQSGRAGAAFEAWVIVDHTGTHRNDTPDGLGTKSVAATRLDYLSVCGWRQLPSLDRPMNRKKYELF